LKVFYTDLIDRETKYTKVKNIEIEGFEEALEEVMLNDTDVIIEGNGKISKRELLDEIFKIKLARVCGGLIENFEIFDPEKGLVMKRLGKIRK
jgi:hypothetical protein